MGGLTSQMHNGLKVDFVKRCQNAWQHALERQEFRGVISDIEFFIRCGDAMVVTDGSNVPNKRKNGCLDVFVQVMRITPRSLEVGQRHRK